MLIDTIKQIAQDNIPQKPQNPKQDYITAETLTYINRRKEWRKRDDITDAQIQELSTEIKSRLRQDKKQHILNTVRHELDVRDNWAGIRALKREYTPLPYNRKDPQGNIVAQGSRAETAAQ
eukprot:3069330-Karenia_brevis.AAC.1